MDISFSLNKKSSRNLPKMDNFRRSMQKVPNSDQTLKMVTTDNKIESKKESQKKDSSGLLLVGTNKIISLQKEEELKEDLKEELKEELKKEELKEEKINFAVEKFMMGLSSTRDKGPEKIGAVLRDRLKVLNQLMDEGIEHSEEIFKRCFSEYKFFCKNGIVYEPYTVGTCNQSGDTSGEETCNQCGDTTGEEPKKEISFLVR